jgi:hypothetical protein
VTTVGCIQSSYIPWRGYFDLIRRSDVFVFHDDIQYTKQDWRNRNRIKTAAGLTWLSIPVRSATTRGTIDEVEIDNEQDWGRKHWRTIETHYRKAPFFSLYAGFFEETLTQRWDRLSNLNIYVISNICETLGIKTRFVNSRSLGVTGRKTERLIHICRACGATRYLSGPSARNYIEPEKFAAVGVEIDYMAYNYPPYPQQFGAFVEGASIVDLLFNCGPMSIEFIVGEGATHVQDARSRSR